MFIKNANDTENPKVRAAYGKFTGIFGIVSNFVLFFTKITLGIITSSIAVTADAINNLSDAGSSLFTIISFRIAEKPADKEHPYGHARMESISGLIISCLITSIGIDLLISSVEKIFSPEQTTYSLISIIILFCTVAVKLIQGLIYRSAGKKIKSDSLIASSTDSINDVISTCVVIAGALVGMIFNINPDGYFGCAVALFVIWSGIKLIKETADSLLGKAPEEELVRQLSQKIMSYEGILGIHDLMVHNYGFGKVFATSHAEVSSDVDVMVSHDLIDNIEFDVLENMNIHLVLHLDPVENNNPKVQALKEQISELVKEFDSRITIHDFRAVFGNSHTNLIFDVALPFDYKTDDDVFSKKLTERIRELDKDYNTVITVDRIYMNSRHKS